MRKHWLWLGLMIVFTTLLSCGKKPQTVARVGDEVITLAEFKAALIEQYKTRDFSQISFENKLAVLENLLDKHRRILKARELGLDKTPEFLRRKKERADLLLAQTLYMQEVIDPLIPEKLLRRYYRWQQRPLEVSYIKLGYRGAPQYKGSRTEEETRNLARELVAQLQQGADFHEYVLQFSDDPQKKKNQGRMQYPLGRFGLEADSAVYAADIHQIVGPFKGPDGYYIFRIEKRNYQPAQQKFQQARERLRQKVYNWYFAEKAARRFEEKSRELQQQYQVQFQEGNLERFFAIAQQWAKDPATTDADFTPEQRELVLVRFRGGQITAGDLIDKFRGGFKANFARYNSVDKLREFLEKRVVNLEIWAREARARGLEADPTFQRQMREFELSQLNALLDQKVIQNQVEISETELEKYYRAHIDEYREPEKIRVWEIAVKNEQLAKEIARRARQGESFIDLAAQYNEKRTSGARPGDLGYLSRNSTNKLIAQKAFEAGPNQIVGPFKAGIYYSILKTGDLKPARTRPLREVRGLVENALRREKERALREEFIKKVRKEYWFQVNDSLIRRLS